MSRAEDEEGAEERGVFPFEIILIYTLVVIACTLMAQRMWEAAVRGVEFFMKKCLSTQPGSHSTEAEEETEGPSPRERPAFLAEESSATIEGGDQTPDLTSAPQPAEEHAPLPPENAPLPDQPSQAVNGPAPPTWMRAALNRDEEWDEIEREERLVRAELNSALPGDPILGPVDQLEDDDFPGLPFQVLTTRFGTVYHLHRNCRYLAAPGTGPVKAHGWCGSCRRAAHMAGRPPTRGAPMFITGWHSNAHSDMRCTRALGAPGFTLCTACAENT